jgi:DNA-directed RNA polymerase beta subunit
LKGFEKIEKQVERPNIFSSRFVAGVELAKIVVDFFLILSGKKQIEDRDNIAFQREDDAGTLTAHLLRQVLTHFTRQSQNILYRMVERGGPIVPSVVFNHSKIQKKISSAFISGNWGPSRNSGKLSIVQ